MAERGLESGFEFISYKVTELNFSMDKNLDLLSNNGIFKPDLFEFGIGIRPPIFIKKRNIYVCGVSLKVILDRPAETKPDTPAELETTTPAETKPDTPAERPEERRPLLMLDAAIEGAFRTKEKFPEDFEKSFVRSQAPTILFPYLRAAISSFFANAGFGPVLIPLVNMNKVAESQLKDKEIEVMEQD